MRYEEEVIQKLTAKVNEIRSSAAKERRAMSPLEIELVSEMEAEIQDLRMQLPVSNPVTLQGGFSGGPVSAGGRSGKPFETLGQQLQAVMSAGLPHGRPDSRLFEVRGAASGLNETTPSQGGFLLQQDFSTELLNRTYRASQIASRCTRIQIGSNANSISLPAVDETSRASGSRWGGVTSHWVSEGQEITKSKPAFRKLELSLKKLTGLCYATDELIRDSSVLEQIINVAFVDEFSFVIDDAVLRGTGAGQPLGILNAGCLVTVAKESGQTADTILVENLAKMLARLPARSRPKAAWFVHPSCEPQLLTLSIAVGTGGVPIYMPSDGSAPFNRLLGLPVIYLEQASVLGDLGDIILADFGEYLIAERGGIQSASSIHVRFVYDEQVFRFVWRIDGQPIPAGTLNPYSGSDATSPFIVLQAR